MWPGHFCEIHPIKWCSLCIEQDLLKSPPGTVGLNRDVVSSSTAGWGFGLCGSGLVDHLNDLHQISPCVSTKDCQHLSLGRLLQPHTHLYILYINMITWFGEYVHWRSIMINCIFLTQCMQKARWSDLGSKTLYVIFTSFDLYAFKQNSSYIHLLLIRISVLLESSSVLTCVCRRCLLSKK